MDTEIEIVAVCDANEEGLASFAGLFLLRELGHIRITSN